LLGCTSRVTPRAHDGIVIKGALKINFDTAGAETRLEVAAPKTADCVAALTDSLRATNIRAKLQFTVRNSRRWLAQLRLTEMDGTPISPARARELLRAFEQVSTRENRLEDERSNAA